LLNGAPIVPVAKTHAHRAALRSRRHAPTGITTMFLTTALFNAVAREAPDAFRPAVPCCSEARR